MEAPILFRIVVMLAALPWFVLLSARLRDAREYLPLALTFYLTCGAVAAGFVERAFELEVMDTVQHGLYGLAAVVAVFATWRLRSAVTARRAAR